MKIITLNLNPVYDIFYRVPQFRPYKENIADSVSVFIGGKGTNVSRALRANGYHSTAFILLGRENCQIFTEKLREEGIDARFFYTEGRLRENVTVLSDGIPETRICMNDFSTDANTLDLILSEIAREASRDSVIVCSGKFPKGIGAEEAISFVRELKRLSDRVVLDSNTFTAAQIIEIAPWLIKPNEEEIEALAGRSFDDPDSLFEAARSLRDGGIGNILISLGGKGAVYSGELGECAVSVPVIRPLSTIGAGDSTVAGFLAAFSENAGLAECLRRACAFGSAACLEPGTNPPRPDNVASLEEQIGIRIRN